MFPALLVQDCHCIAKAFEKGANFCTTEESVFAMMTPILVGMRSNARAYIKMATAQEAVLSDDNGLITDNTTKSDNPMALIQVDDPGIATTGSDSPTNPTKELTAKREKPKRNSWSKDCIPCDLRLQTAADLFKQMYLEMSLAGLQYKEMFLRMIQLIRDMFNFMNKDKYGANICALWNWMKQFVCLPDFRRIITALMAFLVLMAMELNSLFDLMIQLIVPLILPFLMAIINPLQQMLLLIIKPLQCIIDALTAQIMKLDYSAIFNVKVPNITLGSPVKKKPTPALTSNTTSSPLSTATQTQAKERGFNISPAQLFSSHTQAEADAVKQADKELEDLRAKGGSLDQNNTKAREDYAKELVAARAKAQQARENQSKTAVQKAVDWQRQQMMSKMQDAFRWIIQGIDRVKKAITEFVNMITSEIRKFIQSFLGGSETAVTKLFDKLQIIQLIALIRDIIDALSSKKLCKEEEVSLSFTKTTISNLLGGSGSEVWTDEDGTTHIEENSDILSDAINSVVGATGQGLNPNVAATTAPSTELPTPTAKVIGTGSSPLDATRQRVKSLIELTGDPVLDTSIARTVDSMTSPLKLQFKCPMQTSVANAEQVNKWMAELNSQ